MADDLITRDASGSGSEFGFDDFLREIPLFADLDARALAELRWAARPARIDAGVTLFRQGDAPNGLYLIKDGEIDISRRLPGDELVKLATLGRGALVGEMGLLDCFPRSAHAFATKPTTGYFVGIERFHVVQSDYRAPAFAVMHCFRRAVAARARTALDALAAFGEAAQTTGPTERMVQWPTPRSPSTFDEAVLNALPLFGTLQLAELRQFIAPMRRFDFGPGDRVYAAGDAPRSCVLIVRGALSTLRRSASGSLPFAVHGPGQVVGDLALFDGLAQPLDCLAREPTIAFEIDRAQFERLRRGGDVIALRFFAAVTSSIVEMLRKANAHMARLVAERRHATGTTATLERR
jgi:CRP/FNR family transcriptional regulator, cyclic AMP receptor protein